eukprot:scaffold421_cov333-Pavlova_lutheri.AAC.2
MELPSELRLASDGFAMLQCEFFQACAKVLHLLLGRLQLHLLDRAAYVQVLCTGGGLVLQPLDPWTSTHDRTMAAQSALPSESL